MVKKKFQIGKILIVLIIGGIGVGAIATYQKKKGEAAQAKYVLAQVERGFISSSITGTGQVTSENQFDVKPETAGDVIAIPVQIGQEVGEGAILVELDGREAKRAIRDASSSVQSARLALEKLKKPVDTLSILQAQNAIVQAEEAKEKAIDDLASARLALEKLKKPADTLSILQAENAVLAARESYAKALDDLNKNREEAFNKVAAAFIDLPGIINGVNDIFFQSTIDRNQFNIDWYENQLIKRPSDKIALYKNDVSLSYSTAKTAHAKSFELYKKTPRSAEGEEIDTLLKETEDTVQRVVEAVKASNTFLAYVQDVLKDINVTAPASLGSHRSSIDAYTSKSNSHLIDLSSSRKTIESGKNSEKNAERAIREKEESLEKLKTGAEPLDIQAQELVVKSRQTALVSADRLIGEKRESLAKLRKGADEVDIQSAELSVQQKVNAQSDAEEKLEDYIIRAPIAGTIATLDAKIGDSLSTGAVVSAIITSRRVAEISLNEVDTAKVAVGQKATLSFDAIANATISGSVVEIDTIGTVSQGVVSYTVTISFDTQDSRIKPGMTVSASIITDSEIDTLIIPVAALKTQGTQQYVEVPVSEVTTSFASAGNGATRSAVPLDRPPRRQQVSVGISSDEKVQVLEGLKEGDIVITSTIQPSAQNSRANGQQAAPAIRIPGVPGGGGGGRGGFR